MRSRNIKPGFFLNDELGELPPLARILFVGLWCLADRAGRLEDKPKRIRAAVLPYDECDGEELLSMLACHGFIVRYAVDGENYIQISNFTKHQNPHQREPQSAIPQISDIDNLLPDASTGQAQCKDEPLPEPARLIPDSLIPDSLIPDSLVYSSEVSDETIEQVDGGMEEEESPPEHQTAKTMTNLLINELQRNNPAFRPPTGPKRSKWDNTMKLMLTRDKRSPADMERIIRWCQADSFWKGNILSADALRKHFDRFLVQSKAGQNRASGPGAATPRRDNFEQRQYDDSFFESLTAASLGGSGLSRSSGDG